MENLNFNNQINLINKLIVKIFDLVKQNEWDELYKLIENNDIDYNIKDISNTYLLEYLIIFNQVKIIKLIVNKNIRIDIIDEENRSILYNAIKYSFIEIIEILLDKNKSNIGNNILEIKDSNDNIPLFYAIKFLNIKAVNIIIDNMDNFYMVNNEGDNALHLAVKSLNLEIFKIIYDKITQIYLRNSIGETIFHIAVKVKAYNLFDYIIEKNIQNNKLILIKNLNTSEYRYNFTVIHYCFIYMDIYFIMSLKKYGILNDINFNTQDISGNIFLHYFINNISNYNELSNEQYHIINQFLEIIQTIKFNCNLYNIDGNTPIHLLSIHINKFKKFNLDILINFLITNADINILNYESKSPLYYIVKNNFWKNIINLLVNKKLDIYVITSNKKTIFDFIEYKDFNKFVNIVSDSYMFLLNNHNNNYNNNHFNKDKENDINNYKWYNSIDNYCSYDNYKLTDNDYKELNKLGIMSKTNNQINNQTEKNIFCKNYITEKIKHDIEIFKKTNNNNNLYSYPIIEPIINLIDNYPNVILSTFTGSTLDILFGLVFLNKKYKNTKNFKNYQINSSLELLDLSKSIINCNIIDIKTEAKICEITGFEIIWKNNLLFIPSSKTIDITSLIINNLNNLNKNKNNHKFFIIPIGIELTIENQIFSHANYLIWDLNLMEVERFEPHGSDPPTDLNYNANLLDKQLESIISNINIGFTYFPPKKYLSKIGFQKKEISEIKGDYIGDPNGFCGLWCIWWADMRMKNPSINRDTLFKLLNKELISKNISYKKMIRDYSFFITTPRDIILKKSNTNINEWINDTISQHDISNLNNNIIDDIIKLF